MSKMSTPSWKTSLNVEADAAAAPSPAATGTRAVNVSWY